MQQNYRMAAAAVYLTITKPGASLIEATIRYFSFFTMCSCRRGRSTTVQLSSGSSVRSFIYGVATGFYPYPFINVREFGYDKIFLNMGVLLLVFIALSLALIAIDRRIGIAQTKTAASS